MSSEAQEVGVSLSCGIEVREGELQGFWGDSEDMCSVRGAPKKRSMRNGNSQSEHPVPLSEPLRGESVDITVRKAYSRQSISAAEKG